MASVACLMILMWNLNYLRMIIISNSIPFMMCVVLNLILPQLFIACMIGVAPGNCKLRIKKCFVITISTQNQDLDHHVYGTSNHVFAAYVNNIRDLGIIIDSHLKFDQHIDIIVREAMSRAYLILKAFHSRGRSLMVKAYCTSFARAWLTCGHLTHIVSLIK
jgi:hypothetical protein